MHTNDADSPPHRVPAQRAAPARTKCAVRCVGSGSLRPPPLAGARACALWLQGAVEPARSRHTAWRARSRAASPRPLPQQHRHRRGSFRAAATDPQQVAGCGASQPRVAGALPRSGAAAPHSSLWASPSSSWCSASSTILLTSVLSQRKSWMRLGRRESRTRRPCRSKSTCVGGGRDGAAPLMCRDGHLPLLGSRTSVSRSEFFISLSDK